MYEIKSLEITIGAKMKKTSLHDNNSNQIDKGKNSYDVKNNVRSAVIINPTKLAPIVILIVSLVVSYATF